MTSDEMKAKFHRLAGSIAKVANEDEAIAAGIVLDILLDVALDHKRIADAFEDLCENGVTTYTIA